ncbi:TIGR01212 family radical SAM protein [Syntrophomonas curvata]
MEGQIFWGDKRYHSLNYHLQHKLGGKVFKIPLDAGFTCPNRDGRLSRNGCLFCSAQGSGDFAGRRGQQLTEQFNEVKPAMHAKWPRGKYIAYFQAFTNTYAPVERLRDLYYSALGQEGVVGLAIATRPDCLPDAVLDLLQEINEKTYLWVELGLQSIHARSMQMLNLQYTYKDFCKALLRLQRRGIETCAHIILGLPYESEPEMTMTGRTIADLPLQGVKLHLLHIMKGTPLAAIYQQNPFPVMEKEQYIDLVVDILEILPPEMIIHRLTGDSPRALLIAPQWSLKKWEVLNGIDHCLQERNTWQGKYYIGNKSTKNR